MSHATDPRYLKKRRSLAEARRDRIRDGAQRCLEHENSRLFLTHLVFDVLGLQQESMRDTDRATAYVEGLRRGALALDDFLTGVDEKLWKQAKIERLEDEHEQRSARRHERESREPDLPGDGAGF